MRILYSLIMILLPPLVAPLFMLRMRGRARLRERYGLWDLSPTNEVVWFHAASVGEVNGMLPFVRQCKEFYPDCQLLLTSTSVTGLNRAQGSVDFLRLLPFDAGLWIWLASRKIQVKAYFFGETELWPNLLRFLQRRGTPIHMINGVISDQTYSRYVRLRRLFASSLKGIATLSMSDQQSAERIILLGADSDRVKVTGNAKYDRPPTIQTNEQREQFRQQMGLQNLPTLVLASIHPGELSYWLHDEVITHLQKKSFQLVIAPRHHERVPFFVKRLKQAGISYRLRSSMAGGSEKLERNEVILVDTMGELERIFSLSTLTFVGGTLVPIGGHNPLEAASYSNPLCVGPHTFKIVELVSQLHTCEALVVVKNSEQICAVIARWLEDPIRFQNMGAQANTVYKRHLGSTERMIEHVFRDKKKDEA